MRPRDDEDRMGFAEYYDPHSLNDHSLIAARWRLFRVHLTEQPGAAAKLRDEGLGVWRRVCKPHPARTLIGAYYAWSVYGLEASRDDAWAREGLRAVNAYVLRWLREQPWPQNLAPVAHRLFAPAALNALADWDHRGNDVAPRDLRQRLVHIQEIPVVDYPAIFSMPPGTPVMHYYPACEFWLDAEKRVQQVLGDRKLRQQYRRAVEAVYWRAGWRQTPTKRRRVLTPQLQFEHAYAYLMMPGVSTEKILHVLGTSVAASTFRQNVGSILDYVFYGTDFATPFRPPKPVRERTDALA